MGKSGFHVVFAQYLETEFSDLQLVLSRWVTCIALLFELTDRIMITSAVSQIITGLEFNLVAALQGTHHNLHLTCTLGMLLKHYTNV